MLDFILIAILMLVIIILAGWKVLDLILTLIERLEDKRGKHAKKSI